MPGATVSLRATVNPERQDEDQRQVPLTGTVRHIFIQIPPGAQNLVDVRVLHNGAILLPSDGGTIRGDDVQLELPVDANVRAGDYVSLWVGNRDRVHPHTVTAIVPVESGQISPGMSIEYGQESVRTAGLLQGSQFGLGDAMPVPVTVTSQPAQPNLPVPVPQAAPMALQPQLIGTGSEAFMLGQQAVLFLGTVAVIAVIAVVAFAFDRRESRA